MNEREMKLMIGYCVECGRRTETMVYTATMIRTMPCVYCHSWEAPTAVETSRRDP